MIELEEKQRVLVATESDEYVLVKVSEIEELIEQIDNQPVWATGIKWLANQTGFKSPQYLQEKILYPHRGELEEIVSYPDEGGNWRFHIKEMKKWLDKNFRRVNK